MTNVEGKVIFSSWLFLCIFSHMQRRPQTTKTAEGRTKDGTKSVNGEFNYARLDTPTLIDNYAPQEHD